MNEKQYFVLTEKQKVYDIIKMHKIIKSKPLFGKYMNINKFLNQLSENVWDIGKSPLDILYDPDYNIETRIHMNKILEVDYESYSIYILENYTVIDGYHRLCRAKLDGKKFIRAIIISEEILELCLEMKNE
jgi:hypothetical protein